MSDAKPSSIIALGPGIYWRPTTPDDIAAIGDIENVVHLVFGPERPEVHRERMTLFPDGHRILVKDTRIVGYSVAYPWRLSDVPKLDTFLDRLPTPAECLFVHDVAMLPEAQGHGAAKAFITHVTEVAHQLGLNKLALVSVYGTTVVWSRLGFRITPPPGGSHTLKIYGETAAYMTADI